jgi:hypothetical protein
VKVLWVSRNNPIPSQIKELQKLFGDDVNIHLDNKPFSAAGDIVTRFRKGNYDEMVLIAPLTVCKVMCDFGIKPLWSEMKRVPPSQSEVTVFNTRERIEGSERHYKFIKFKRLESVGLVFSDLPS